MIPTEDKEAMLSPEEIQGYFYRVSTSPEPFTENDGTLNQCSFVRLKELLNAQIAKMEKLGYVKVNHSEGGWRIRHA